MRKKSKHKRKKKKLTCPHEGVFGYDIDELDECENCPLYGKCEATFNKRTGAEIVEDDEDDITLPQKQKGKPKKAKPKKRQDHRGAYIPLPALNKLLKLTNHFCVKLYLFYMRVGIIQKTNQIWCNNNYVAKGLECDKDRVRITKNQLVKAGYITIIRERDKRGHLGKSYIKIKYFPSKMVIENAECLRQLDEYERQLDELAEEAAEWFGVLMARGNKFEVECAGWKRKYKKLKRKYRRLKQG